MTRASTAPVSTHVPAVSERQVRSEMVRALFHQSPTLIVGNLLVVLLLVFLLWGHVSQAALLGWTALIAGLNAVRIAMVRRYQRVPADDSGSLARGWVFTFFAGLSGGIWGAAGVVFFQAQDPVVIPVLCVVLPAMTGAAVASLSLFPPAYYALAFPAVVPLGVRALLQGDPYSVGLGVFVFALLGISLLHSRGVFRSARESVLLRFENAALAGQLSLEKERAEAANRAKSQFLAAASHDLRQPTHALSLFVATLRNLAQRPQLERAAVEHIAARLQTALQSMGRLLNSLLDVSRLDAGVVEVRKRPVALCELLADLDEEFSGPAKAGGIELKVMPTTLWADTDPMVLLRVLANLTSNAVRYTERGRVLIGCRRRGDTVAVQVLDTGIGIAPDQLQAVFQEFYQVHGVRRGREQGLGLGLSIVWRSAELLGARVEVKSSLGKGSAFTLVLPRAAPVRLPEKITPHASRSGTTILAIDDNREVLEAMRQLLSSWGHVVIPAGSVEQAVAAAQQMPAIGLILADYHLGDDETGSDAIRAVRSHLGRNIPAAIITGDTSPKRILEVNASGFTLLHKPLDPRELLQLLNA